MPNDISPETIVPLVETSLRPISPPDIETLRVRQSMALDYPEVMRNLNPELITTRRVKEPLIKGEPAEIGAYNVLSPYTSSGPHVMLLDRRPVYTPTPSEIPDPEGEEIRSVSADIVSFQTQLPGIDRVSWGYNCSPLNFGVAEEVTGMQSLPTKFHPQIWSSNLKEAAQVGLKDERVSESAKNFMIGDSFNKIIGAEIAGMILNSSDNQFINPKTVRVDTQGFHIALNSDLETALSTPGFFSRFIKPLHQQLEGLMAASSTAFTDLDYTKVKNQIKTAFESGDTSLYQKLQVPPKLLTFEQRERNIKELKSLGYGSDFVEKLLFINRMLKDRTQDNEPNWMRKGFGYSLVINQDTGAPNATLHIRPATLIRSSRGGVAEVGMIALKRSENKGTGELLTKKNIRNINALRAYLDNRDHSTLAA